MDSPILPKRKNLKFASEEDHLTLSQERGLECVRLMPSVERTSFLYSLAHDLLHIKSISSILSTLTFTAEQCQIASSLRWGHLLIQISYRRGKVDSSYSQA
jgi:hypothetical protein